MAFAMSEEERKRQALANYALQQGNINLRVKDIPKAPGVTVTDQPQRYSVKVGPSMQVEPIKVSTPYSVRNFLAGQNDKYSSMPSYNKGIIGFLEKKYDAVNANSPQDIFKRSLQGQQASYEGPNFGGRLRDMSVGALRETAKIPENIYRSIDEASSTIEAQKINDAINEKDPAKKRIKISKISDPRGPLVKLGKTKTLDSNMSDDELIKIRNELLQKRTAAPKYTEGAKRFLYGSEPVQSYQQRARGLREELATGTSVAQQALGTEGTAGKVTKFLKEKADIIAPALAGLTVIGDVTPVGKSKNAAKLPKEDLKILSKSVDPNEVKAVVSKNNIELSDNAVKDIVEAKNTKTVNKIIGEDLKAASDNIAKEADNLVGQKIDNQNITNVAKTTEPTRNEAVSDAVVTELVKTKTPQEVTDAVDALFPTLPKEEKINLTNKIAQTQDVNQIKQLVEEAKARETQLKETVQVNTPEQVATTQAEQTQQAMEQAVPAPKPAPESTQAPIIQEPTTTAPDGVQGATAADNVPGAAPVEKTAPKFTIAGASQGMDGTLTKINNAPLTKEEINAGGAYAPSHPLYEKSVDSTPLVDIPPVTPDLTAPVPQSFGEMLGEKAGKFWQRFKEQVYDPLSPWQRAEDARNRALGVKMKNADASRSFTHLLNQIVVSDQNTLRNLTAKQPTGQSVADVFAKYPDDTIRDGVESNEFILYLQARFFGEIYEKSGGKVWKGRDYSPDQAQRYIADFEAQNPTARQDADTLKSWADSKVDAKVASREITPEHGENIKNAYTVFTPLDQAKDPDLVSATISGGRGGVGTERIAQNLTEEAGDYDTSWKSVFNRERRYNSETAENNLTLELDRSVREGSLTKEADDVYIVVDPEKQAQRAEVMSRMDALRAKIEVAKKGRGKLATQKRLSKKDLEQAQTEAAELARQYYITQAVDAAGVGFAKKMGRAELLDMFEVLTSANEVKAKRIINKLEKRGGEYKRLSEQLRTTREDIAIMRAEASGDWRLAAQLNEKKPKFDNVVPYYKDGFKGYMHISADMARVRNEMKQMADNSTASKVVQGIANAQKWLFTGAGAPIFKLVINPIRSQVQAYTLAPGLSAFGARPIGQGIKTVFSKKTSDAYMQRLMDYGFSPEVSTKTSFQQSRGVKQVASMSSKSERAKYLGKHWGELFNVLNSGMAKLDNSARIQVAKGVELRMRRRHPDWTEDQIMSAAAKAGNDILGNFNRVSKLARSVEPLLLYSGATQSGYRQMMRTFRERPIETGLKVMSLVGAVTGSTMFMLGMGDDDYIETMKEYYDQKIASGNTAELDSNLIIGIPGVVDYDEKTNTWKGIVKIPLPPDYKPLVRASWKTAYEAVVNKKFDPAMIGRELANFGTADQASNIRNPKTGMLLPSSPVGTFARIALGQDPRTGKQLETEYEKTQPRTERYNKYTSDLAKNLSKVTNGAFTPKMIDAILSQSGYFGSKLKSIEEGEAMSTLQSVVNDFTSKVYGSKGFSEKQQEGKEFATKMDELYRKYGFNENEYNLAKTLYPTKKDKDGKDIKPKGYYVSSNRAGILANSLMSGDTDLWEFAKDVSKINREPGDPVDPLYELDNDKAQQILALMAQPNPQNLDNKVIRKQNPWIKDFYTKRAEFFDKIIEKQKTNYEKDVDAGLMTQDELAEIQGNAGKDFMGVTIPKMSPKVKALQAKYDELKKGDDATARFEFMKDNPELQQYYDDKNDYDRFKRTVMRLPLLDEYPKASPKVQAIQDEYNALPKNDGPISKYTGKATSPSRSAWFKANPAKAALLTEQWYKQNLFDLQGAAALAAYEGEALDEDAFDDIKKIAEYRDKLASGTNGYGGYSKFGYNFAPKEAVFKVSNLLGGIQPGDIKQSSIVKTTPNKVKFKAQKPSGKSRTTKRLRLQ